LNKKLNYELRIFRYQSNLAKLNFFLYFENYNLNMCNEIEYQMIFEMLEKAKQKELQKKVEKPIEVLAK